MKSKCKLWQIFKRTLKNFKDLLVKDHHKDHSKYLKILKNTLKDLQRIFQRISEESLKILIKQFAFFIY